MMWWNPIKQVLFILTACGVAANFAISAAAQDDNPINSNYGQAKEERSHNSVNGTSVFAEMFRDSGRRVHFAKRISSRINKHDTIVWFHNKFGSPSREVEQELEQWLDQDRKHVLIYVGRDFDAELMYWRNALQVAPANQKPDIQRQINYVEGRWEGRRYGGEDRSNWFSVISQHDMQRVNSFAGSWSYLINPNRAEIYRTAEWAIPNQYAYKYSSIALLVDGATGDPLITELELNSFTGGRIIVCQNGSSLLNLPLINSENRKIASLIIDECPKSSVLFLESGIGDPEIADSDQNTLGVWSWATKKPLCYMVPHFVLLGIVFCFVYFPIFGRGKKIKPEANTDFANHLQATAQLLQHSKNQRLAQQKIEYAQSVLEKKHQSH